MANIEYKPVWSEDGQTLSNVLVKDKLETYNVTDVWYDGTPLDDSKLDSDLVYVKYEGKYLVRNFEYGQVLQKDTMQEMRDLSPYEILLLKMGVYKHVQLNGYYEKGDTPAPINYTLSDTEEVDDGGSVIEVGNVKLEHEFTKQVINALYFGAKGDDVQDDTERIQKAFDYAYEIGLITTLSTNIGVELPINNVYKVTDTISVRTGVNVIMEGRLRYHGVMDRPVIVIGEELIPNRGVKVKLNISTIRAESTWDNDQFVGARLINSNQGNIEVKLIDGFYKGLECVGIGQGFAYNQVYIRVLNSNKYGVYLDYMSNGGSIGWCNENVFYGGRFSTQSGFNSGKGRYGARVTGDDNRFIYPSFELDRLTSSPEHSVAVLMQDAENCRIEHCRNEGNSSVNSDGGYAFIVEGGSTNNYIHSGYSFNKSRSLEKNAFKDSSSTRQNVYISNPNLFNDLQFGRVIFDSGYMPSRWVSTDANRGHCAGVKFLSLDGVISEFTPDNRGSRKHVEGGGNIWVELDRTAFAVEINTEFVKKIGVIRDGRNGRNGVVGIKFFDSEGVEITSENVKHINDQTENLPIQQIFSYSSSYGGSWITGTPAPNNIPVYFSVKEEVKSIILFIGQPSSRTSLKSFQILSLDNTGKGASVYGSDSVSSDGLRRVYGNNPPSYGTYFQGEVIFTRGTERGTPFGFLCSTNGTSTPINTTGEVKGARVIGDIPQTEFNKINIDDRVNVDGTVFVVTSVKTDDRSITVSSNINKSIGIVVAIKNQPPEWTVLGLKDMEYVTGSNPNGNINAVSGAIAKGIGGGMSSNPLWVKTTGYSDTSGWKRVVLEDDVATTSAQGLVRKAVAVPDGSSVDDLLQALRDAGIIEE